jgi:hypothetical protein
VGAPLVRARVEELNNFTGTRINRTEIGSFVTVTVKARVSKVLRRRLPTMFPGPDVTDFMRVGIEFLAVRLLTILASLACPFDHCRA